MNATLRSADYASYRDAAGAILIDRQGSQAVDTFGLRDVFSQASGTTDCSPAYAFLEAQGYQCAVTPALGMLALVDLRPSALGSDGDLLLALPFGAAGRMAVTGMHSGTSVLVDQPNVGLVALPGSAVLYDEGDRADDYVTVLDHVTDSSVVVADDVVQPLRMIMLARIRLGVAAELLGVCDRLLDDAVAHVRLRRQFGSALGDFQAVQHLLAWAATERHQLRCLFDIAVRQSEYELPDPVLAETVKAMAGRVLHAIAQVAIQVTGAISFTWEYSLNRLHQRGIALDQLAGPSADLVAQIGRRVRTEHHVPALFEIGDLSA